MRRIVLLLVAPAAVLASLAACGTETGNPEATVEVEYNARSTDPDLVELVDGVWLRIDVLALSGGCGGPADAVVPALGWADHSGADAAVQAVDVPNVPYCTLATSFFADAGATGEAPELQGASVALTGTLDDGRAFRVVLREDVPLELTLDDAEPPDVGAWLLSFDVATWLDLGALEALPGDPVVVDEDTNPALLDEVRARLADGVQLHHDADRNGRVDPGERRLDLP